MGALCTTHMITNTRCFLLVFLLPLIPLSLGLQPSTSCCAVTRLRDSSSTSTLESPSVRTLGAAGCSTGQTGPGIPPLKDGLCCLFAQISTSAERSPESVPTACVSTRSGASAASVPWASATTTYCSSAKVENSCCKLLLLSFPSLYGSSGHKQ